MIGRAVDDGDVMDTGEPPAQMVCGDQPSDATTQDDDAGGSGGASASARHRRGVRLGLCLRRSLVELSDGGRVAGLVELVLREENRAVASDEDVAGDPSVRQLPEERSLRVGDYGERQVEPGLPRFTGGGRFERTDADDLEAVRGEAIEDATDGRSLLPAGQSGVLPKDDEQPAGAFDRQTECVKGNRRPCHGALGGLVEDFHLRFPLFLIVSHITPAPAP